MKRISLLALGLLFSFSSSWASQSSELKDLGSTPERAVLAESLTKGLEAYEKLKDYRATFQKQERSGQALEENETIFLKFEKPFKLFMGWTNTHKKGLQVFYERGKHDGKLAIHKPGLLLGLAPLIFLEQDSPWVREGSASYNIEDAGIGTFMNDFTSAVLKGAAEGRLDVKTQADAMGLTADVTFAGSAPGGAYFAERVVVHFDAKTALPDRMQLFDWDKQPMGIYAYEDLKLDIGMADEEFKKTAHRKICQLYFPNKIPASTGNNFSGKSPRATPSAA